jgi:hypothetical protein
LEEASATIIKATYCSEGDGPVIVYLADLIDDVLRHLQADLATNYVTTDVAIALAARGDHMRQAALKDEHVRVVS